jgi:superfamily II DNA or RNA helicase
MAGPPRRPPDKDPDPANSLFQSDLFTDTGAIGWPRYRDFPYNQDRLTVGDIVREDLDASTAPLVITGYASLERVIEWLAHFHTKQAARSRPNGTIRLLLGHEPHPTLREEWRGRRHWLAQEVSDYWLDQGVSLLLSMKIVAVLELLRHGHLQVKTSGERPVHAKVYVADNAVTLGSSNFSHSGFVAQIEANVRFTAAGDATRFAEAKRLGEAIWREGEDYTEGFEELLRALLQNVTWREALARACAELLEGSWASRYASASSIDDRPTLWPSQEQGIAHALWILENQGSVLVADATGSGKTLMGVHLVKRIMNRLWRTGRARTDLAVLMAPPSVLPNWDRDAVGCGLALEKFSQGHLSRPPTEATETLRAAVRRAQLLVIDEAHNFLRRSNRTRALYSNIADHVLLFTATPINRGPEDLLAIVDLLGADNLDDETLKAVDKLWQRRRYIDEKRHAPEREKLRRAIRQFTLRRTKTDLNRLVDHEPEGYRLRSTGRVCRYPHHSPIPYELRESAEDRSIALEIRSLASQLRGLSRLNAPFELPAYSSVEGLTEESYVRQRLRSAAALAQHEVAAALRSSRARLLEHLRGTKAAVDATVTLKAQGLAVDIEKDGVIQRTERIGGRHPELKVAAEVPPWLRDAGEHAAACREEVALYEEIEALVKRMTDGREQVKVELLVRLLREQSLVLAFDSHLITLHDLATRVRSYPNFEVDDEIIVATGGAKGARRRLYDAFAPGSRARGIVALCSDALAEGVNLQAASTVVMLDTPSVIRIAEQRIGRVDRMNSTHDTVNAFWPVDAPEFALKASERLVERHWVVHEHLGSNLPLPATMATGPSDQVVRYEDYVRELREKEKERESRADLQDAFAPVRALVDGPRALVPRGVYELLRQSKARVLSSVAVVRSAAPFGFLAIAGSDYGAPKWVYLPTPTSSPETDLDTICAALREQLRDDPPDALFDEFAAGVLKDILVQLATHEEELLPRIKRRALHEMRFVCARYRKAPNVDAERTTVLNDILSFAGSAAQPGTADRAVLASWWLRVIQPTRHRHLLDRKRRRPAVLKDLRPALADNPIPTAELRTVYDEHMNATPIDCRVVAAIIGVPAA